MTTVKGLLKGLRYISQIFENEKEEEMQIGLPTDVKHVAHIGNDGPSANSPSWMNDFQASSEAAASSGAHNCNGKPNSTHTTKSSTKDNIQKPISNGPTDSPDRRSGKMKQPKRHPHTSSNGSMGSPAREPLSTSKPRRNKNTTTTTSVESPRRQQNSSTGSGSSSQDPNLVPKPSRRKKSKGGGGGSGGGSIRSRAKGSSDSLTDTFPYSPGPGYEMMNSGEMCQKPVYDKYEEGKDCEEISRGIRAL